MEISILTLIYFFMFVIYTAIGVVSGFFIAVIFFFGNDITLKYIPIFTTLIAWIAFLIKVGYIAFVP